MVFKCIARQARELTAAFTPMLVEGTRAAYATETHQPRGSLPGSPKAPICTECIGLSEC